VTDSAPRPQDGPRPVKRVLPAGRFLVCTCRRTADPPYCDGSHAAPREDATPPPGPRIETLTEPARLAWCTCGASAEAPWCDGTHRHFRPSPSGESGGESGGGSKRESGGESDPNEGPGVDPDANSKGA